MSCCLGVDGRYPKPDQVPSNILKRPSQEKGSDQQETDVDDLAYSEEVRSCPDRYGRSHDDQVLTRQESIHLRGEVRGHVPLGARKRRADLRRLGPPCHRARRLPYVHWRDATVGAERESTTANPVREVAMFKALAR
jgi:hypothetical protein